MSLRSQALLDLGLPAAPPTLLELGPLPAGGEVLRAVVPAGPVLVLISTGSPLQLAFEAALFDLLAEAHFPSPRPVRAPGGGLIARLDGPSGPAAAACYPWPPGEPLAPEVAAQPQWIDLGRLLARLHLLGEAHPAVVAEAVDGPALAARLPSGPDADALAPVLRAPPGGLPQGACHGALTPRHALFLGERCSALLPGGGACTSTLVLDLAEAAASWALPLAEPVPALRAILSGYQSLRRLAVEERDALWSSLRHAAAREGARRILRGERGGAALLRAADELGPEEVRACAG
jgi:Ser/Thr protein kinase RdoA (MazF antagonist)